MSDINIRPMEDRDIAQAASIHRRILKEDSAVDVGFSVEEFLTAFIRTSPDTCQVAVDGSSVVGFIVGCSKQWSFGVDHSGWIELVEVEPGHMGQGVGKMLGKALVSHFQSKGIKEIFTSVKWDSADMITFFKSIGFDKSPFINLRMHREE